MKRRQFIKVIAAGSATALIPIGLTGCNKSVDLAKKIETQIQDSRLKLIAYAMLAPNPHNIQPWLIKLIGNNSFELYVDQSRLLPETDPPARQIHIGQGTFLEGFRIAASEFGYRIQIDYFPRGEYGNTVVENKPIALVKIDKSSSVSRDPLFNWLLKRQSNKRIYTDKSISEETLLPILNVFRHTHYPIRYTIQKSIRNQIAVQLKEAMKIETAGPARHKESVSMFRFSDEEVYSTRDGFTIGNSGITGIKRWIVETFFLGTREESEAIDSAFAKEGITLTGDQAESATAFAWMVSKSNKRIDQVKIGQMYMQMNLLLARAGISMQPMSQILEEYPEMQQLQSQFKKLIGVSSKDTVQMLFRMGYADPVPHTLRKHVNQIVEV